MFKKSESEGKSKVIRFKEEEGSVCGEAIETHVGVQVIGKYVRRVQQKTE